MNFSLYVVINPGVFRITGGASGASQGAGGKHAQIFNVQKVTDVIKAGATAIQLRGDSAIETSEYSKIAKAVHDVTVVHKIPLVIHDRVDIMVSSGADGVELGKGCLDYRSACKLMEDEKFVGVAVSNKRQAELAAQAQAAYVAIGPVYKPLPGVEFHHLGSNPLGTAGVRDILTHVSKLDVKIPHLVFGGISPENVQRVMFQSKTPFKSVDGVVLGYDSTEGHENMVARIAEIKNLMKSRPRFLPGNLSPGGDGDISRAPAASLSVDKAMSISELLARVPTVVANVVKGSPTFRCMVSGENKDLALRISAAIGSIPDFSPDFEEMKLPGGDGVPQSCFISVSSLTPASIQSYVAALKAYNLRACPVILELKGADGADHRRTVAVEGLMASGYVSVIKGNNTEILHLSGMDKDNGYNKVVNSTNKEFMLLMAEQCKILAARERCVVLATGPKFVLSDGVRTVAIENGSLFLAQTGIEALGPVLAAYLAVEVNDPFLAAFSGVLLFTIASDQAADGGTTRGPGTFLPAFIDEIWRTSQMSTDKKSNWTKRAIVNGVKG